MRSVVRRPLRLSAPAKLQHSNECTAGSLDQPEVIAEGNRWFVVFKPAKWLVEPANLNEPLQSRIPALQSVCRVSLQSETVLFPMRVNQDIAALTFACTDRGMNAQFSRHLASGQIDRYYRALCTFQETSNLDPETFPTHSVNVEIQSPGVCLVTAVASKMRATTLYELLASRGLQLVPDVPFNVQLYRLVFPDPISPGSGDRLSVEMGLPGEWEHLLG